MRSLAVVLVLLTASCAAPAVRWSADSRFTAEEREKISAGVEWLSEASGHDVGGVDFDYQVTSSQPLPHTIRRERGPRPEATGLCAGQTVWLDLDAVGVRPEDVAGLAAHELGHCELGLADDPESEGIMHVITPMRWTAREAGQIR